MGLPLFYTKAEVRVNAKPILPAQQQLCLHILPGDPEVEECAPAPGKDMVAAAQTLPFVSLLGGSAAHGIEPI